MANRQLGSYLEGKVLQEVCSAVGLVGLGARTGIYPHTDGRGLGVWGVLGRNLSRLVRRGISSWFMQLAAYGEAIAQSGALGGCSMAHGSGQTTKKRRWVAGLDRVDSSAAAQTLLQVECKPARSHGHGG